MPNPVERIVSAISYLTFGIFGIIWIIYVNVSRKPMTKFATYNVFQSVMISIVLAVLGLVYDLIYKIGILLGFIGKILNTFDLFFFKTPIYFGYSISGLLVMILVSYLVIFSLLGKKPFVPIISQSVESFGGV